MARTSIDPSLLATIPSTKISGLKVLQIVTGTSTTSFSTSSASFVTTNLSASITPTSSSSKVLILAFSTMTSGNSSIEGDATISRGGSNILASAGQVFFFATGQLEVPISLGYLDSPASTSSLTYAIQIRTSGGTLTLGGSNKTQFIMLVEVVA